MDFSKCFEILQRHSCNTTTCACAFKKDPTQSLTTFDDKNSYNGAIFKKIFNEPDTPMTIEEQYNQDDCDINDLQLIQHFLFLQGKRVMTYRLYEEEFSKLLSSNELQQYNILCMEVTSVFSSISKAIRTLKAKAESRTSLKEVMTSIIKIQEAEREKLTIVAADHLDRMQEHIPTLANMTGGISTHQRDYLVRKIQEIEQKVNDAMENILAVKMDLIE